MDKITQKDIDWLLNLNKSGLTASEIKKRFSLKRLTLLLLLSAALFFALIILPFFLLIRTSVFLSTNFEMNAWLALSGGAFSTILLLVCYVMIFLRKSKNRLLTLRFSFWGMGTLVTAFCIYGVFYLSGVHAKNDAVRDVYRSLHPVLRVAVTTATLSDGELVITDIQREPEDYAQMGLPLNQRSLHFKQQNGFVHAIDLRTNGRSEFRNFFLRLSFRLMGLKTLRHTGTADHLHVALPLLKQ